MQGRETWTAGCVCPASEASQSALGALLGDHVRTRPRLGDVVDLHDTTVQQPATSKKRPGRRAQAAKA